VSETLSGVYQFEICDIYPITGAIVTWKRLYGSWIRG